MALVDQDGTARRDAVPERVTKFSLTPVCWLRSFAGSFALATSFSLISVLSVAFQPSDPILANGFADVIAICEAVAADETISFVVLLEQVETARRNAVPGRVMRLSLTPVGWLTLSSFAGSFALPTSFSLINVLSVAFQPFEPSPVKGLGYLVALNEAVAAEGTNAINGAAKASGAVLDDCTGVVRSEEFLSAGAVFVSVSVTLLMMVRKTVE